MLTTASVFPPYEDMVIDGLTDDEEERFFTAISDEGLLRDQTAAGGPPPTRVCWRASRSAGGAPLATII